MEGELHYAQTHFASALAVLEGRAGSLGGWRDTANNRLRFAILEVYECVPHHFAKRPDYDALAQLFLDIRLRSQRDRLLVAIDNLSAPDAEHFGGRLAAIARGVLSQQLPSQRFGKCGDSESRTG